MNTTACRALMVCALAAAGCGGPPGDEYFPLAAGHEWTYRVTLQRSEPSAPLVDTLVLRTRGRERIAGAPAWRRRSDTGMEYWLRSDEHGIQRVASKTDAQDAPQLDAPPQVVLRRPFVVGTQWEANTTAFVLQRRNEFPQTQYQRHARLLMQHRIAALDERVRTPAGEFAGCMRVDGHAQLRIFFDAMGSWRDSPVTAREWYCRGVGLVRLERSEPSASKLLNGGTVTLELLSWR